MKERVKQKSISNLAALIVFCVFAVGILSVLLYGAEVYSCLTERDRLSYDSRTCAQVVATKIRQAFGPGSVLVSEFGDSDAIIITQDIEGAKYWTRIYCCNGWLMELFTAADADFSPEDGEKLLEAESISISKKDHLLYITIVDGNENISREILYLRDGKGAAK